jgi:hypothetical protein
VKHAHTRVDLRILRELLRLPQEVAITGVRPCPDNSQQCIVELAGAWLPAEGELRAEYNFQNTTIVNFKGWQVVSRDQEK